MNSTLFFTLAFTASLSGFCALGLAMDRHFEDVFGRGREPGRWRRWLQLAGTVLLCISLAASLRAAGSSIGWVLWFGVLTAAALVVVACLSYAPRRTPWLGLVSALAALGGLLLAGAR